MEKELHILFLEDVDRDVSLVREELRSGGLQVDLRQAISQQQFREELQRKPDLILSDHALASFDGLSALAIAQKECPETPFIFVTGALGEEMAVQILKRGAIGFVRKDKLWELTPAVQRALQIAEERRKRVEAEECLRKSEAMFRSLVERVTDYAICMLDPQGRIVTWNAGAKRIYGYSFNEVAGRSFALLFPPEEVEQGLPGRELQHARTTGSSRREAWSTRRDGVRFYSQWVLTAVNDADGKATGFLQVIHDLTDRRRAEEEVNRLNAELEERVRERTAELQVSNQELEAFTYSISHDLRAPLRHIDGFANLLRQSARGKLDATNEEFLRVISDEARQMNQLIDALLNFSRTARAPLEKIRLDLNALLKVVQEDLRFEMTNRRIDWVIGRLPVVHGDKALLRQVLLNLLSNALKYTRLREVARIEVSASSTPTEHIINVRDNGVGFDMRYADKLFGVFQRLHGVDEFEGVGIGLANVRRIIERHGGRTWAEGARDQGACFSFSLPRGKPKA